MTYTVAMHKLATAAVQDFAARQNVATTQQVARSAQKLRPAIVTSRFEPPKMPKVRSMASAIGAQASRLGQGIKSAIGVK